MKPSHILIDIPEGGPYVAEGGIVFGGAAVVEYHRGRDPISYGPYVASGGLVFGGSGGVTVQVSQIYFDIFNPIYDPLVVFFDIFSHFPDLLDPALVEFDVYQGVPGVTVSFDIYSERLRKARIEEDVQMPLAKWVLK